MPTLAFDTSTSIGAVAVIDGGTVLAERTWNRDTSHGELLTPAIQDSLHAAGLSLKSITRLIVGIGPGSFTGCRISVNVARALSFSRNIAVYSVDTFELIAAPQTGRAQPLLVALRGQQNSVLASTFVWQKDRWVLRQSLGSLSLESLSARLDGRLGVHLAVGSAFIGTDLDESLKGKISRDPKLVDQVESRSFLIFDRQIELDERRPTDWKTLQALYLRPSSAEEKRDEGLGIRGS